MLLVAASGLSANAAERFYVGPNKSYKTISSALAHMQDGDVCVIQAGVYRECIHVRLNYVTLLGEGRVVISGCDEAGQMQPCEVNGKKALKAKIPGPVYGVFCGSQHLMLARYPAKTSPMTSNEDWAQCSIDSAGNVEFRGLGRKKFPHLDDGYFVGICQRGRKLSAWHSVSAPIVGVRADGRIIVNTKEASSGYLGGFGRGHGLGYIIGARAVLETPGQWYSSGREVIVIPPVNGKGDYELRRRLYGAVITGNGVRLENIRFQAATARVNGNDDSFVHCSFNYISPFQNNANPKDEPQNRRGQSLVSCWGTPDDGTAGVYVQGDGFVAKNCRFSNSWWCGMMLRGNRARIENCLFENMDWIARRCAGLFCWGNDNVVRYCTFRNLGAAGIEGGNSRWIGQYAKRNIWEHNYVENFCQLIVDQGAFYENLQGASPPSNSIWRYNVCRNGVGPAKGAWIRGVAAYYVDNSSSGFHIYNNIAIHVNQPMKYNVSRHRPNAGKDIWYYNNTFYKCGNSSFSRVNRSVRVQDANLHLVNNLAVSCPFGTLGNAHVVKTYLNNHAFADPSVLTDPKFMNFIPRGKALISGVSVLGKPIGYIGAVNPKQGMWRYGADESKLPAQ